MNNQVAIKHIDNCNVVEVQKTLTELFDKCGASKLFKNNLNVLIKVDAGIAVNPDSALTTHPAVVQAVVNILNSYGANCLVADTPAKQYSQNALDKIYFETGMLGVANSTKAELNHDLSVVELDIPNGKKTKSAWVLKSAWDADAIINIGKLRIDQNLGMLAVSTGIFGLIPGEKRTQIINRLTAVEDFYNFNIDLIEKFNDKIVLNVFDGIVGLESDATQRMLSCLAVAENMFSLDAVVCDIIGKDVQDSIVKTASERGFVNIKEPYQLITGELNKFVLEDFDFGGQTITSNIHKNANKQKSYFNRNQQRCVIDPNKCKGCSRCSKICPSNAIMMKYDKNGELFAKIDYSKCVFCNKCFTACPYKIVNLKTPLNYKLINYNITKYNKE